jgi:hypothetical protein
MASRRWRQGLDEHPVRLAGHRADHGLERAGCERGPTPCRSLSPEHQVDPGEDELQVAVGEASDALGQERSIDRQDPRHVRDGVLGKPGALSTQGHVAGCSGETQVAGQGYHDGRGDSACVEASGRLPAVKRGRDWWLDAHAVERMRRQRPGGGRPLSPAMAWAVVLLASGDEAAAREVAGRDRYWSRARAWLRDHPLDEHAARLRARAQIEQLDAHPSELKHILRRPDVIVTGASAAEAIGLVGSASGVEVYAPASQRAALVDEHALVPGHGPVRVRWVPKELWPHLLGDRDRQAPRVAILLDLLESDEPRARREAARALAP